MPWVTAFSTSGCRISGATRQPPVPASEMSTWRRSPKRTRSISRNRAASASSRSIVIRSSEPSARLSRRKSASRTHIRRAATGSAPVSALIELRLLKRKCGSICARSDRSSASRASTCVSSPRRSDSRACSKVAIRYPTASDSRYRRNPKPNTIVPSAPNTRAASNAAPRRESTSSHARASASHARLLAAAAVTEVIARRASPVRTSGMLRETYHDDRQKKPYVTASGTAMTSAAAMSTAAIPATSPAKSAPASVQTPR